MSDVPFRINHQTFDVIEPPGRPPEGYTARQIDLQTWDPCPACGSAVNPHLVGWTILLESRRPISSSAGSAHADATAGLRRHDRAAR